MIDKNQQTDNIEKKDSNSNHSGKRRALMKGAAATVPVVLTLRSGAAFAAASNELCIARDNKKAGDTPPEVLTSDVGTSKNPWVRMPGFCRTLTKGSDEFKVFNTSDNATSGWEHELNIPDGSSNKTYEEDTTPSGGIVMIESSDSTGKKYRFTESSSCYIVVQITPEKSVSKIGFAGIADANGLPYATGSCWTSVDPANTNPI